MKLGEFSVALLLKTVILMLILCACDPCRNLDCLSSKYEGSLRILSRVGEKDLLFGQDKKYDTNKLRFFALNGSDTTFFDYQPIRFVNTQQGYDSILFVRFYPKTDTAFMQLSTTDLDTLTISYKTYPTKCCSTITEIVGFTNNGIAVKPADERGVWKLLK